MAHTSTNSNILTQTQNRCQDPLHGSGCEAFTEPIPQSGIPRIVPGQKTLNGNTLYPVPNGAPERHETPSVPLPGQEPLPLGGGGPQLRLFAEIDAAALKQKLDKEVAMWYCLRRINYWGSSELPVDFALYMLVQHFGYTKSTAYRLLKAGHGQFWHIRGSVLAIKGLRRVCEYLDTHSLSRAVSVEISDFQTMGSRRTQLYASIFAAQDSDYSRPISRDSIEDATGVGRRQQKRLHKAAGIKRSANFAFRQDENGNLVPQTMEVISKSRISTKIRRLGNTYRSRQKKTNRGMSKRVSKEIRDPRSLKTEGARATVSKRFFTSARSLIRTHQKHVEPFLLVKPMQRLVRGRMEWSIA